MAVRKPNARPVRRPADDIDTIGGDQIQWEELNGTLLAVVPISVERGIRTDFGEREAIYAHVLVVDGENAGVTFKDALIFPATLVGQLKRRPMNKPVLVRLGQGKPQIDEYGEIMTDPATGEPYNAPWKFLACTEDDKTTYFQLRDGRPVRVAPAVKPDADSKVS